MKVPVPQWLSRISMVLRLGDAVLVGVISAALFRWQTINFAVGAALFGVLQAQ